MMFKELETILNYKFTDITLLEEALTHPSLSYNKNHKKFNYERLEFLGDSILSMVIAEYLFKKYKKAKEGELSKRKAFLVSRHTLSNIAKKMGLGKFMITSIGEEKDNGKEKDSNLENIVESIIGAIYLDSNFDNIKKIILEIWSKIDKQEHDIPKDPKTELQELVQKYYKILPEYKLINTLIDKANNTQTFTISLTVPYEKPIILDGNNIKKVESELASEMLNIIKNNNKNYK